MQLCCCGGLSTLSDTEGSFLVDRVIEIASAAGCHLENVAKASQDSDQTESLSAMNLERMLASIHYMRCLNYSDVLSQLALLEDFLLEHPKVKLLVIDSIAFPFRQESMDPSAKTRILSGLVQSLLQLATDKELAVSCSILSIQSGFPED
jgi:RAD51-like protein 2